MELFLLLSPMEWVNKIKIQYREKKLSSLHCWAGEVKARVVLQLKNAKSPHHKLREQVFKIPLERVHIEDPICVIYLTLKRQISCYCVSKLP